MSRFNKFAGAAILALAAGLFQALLGQFFSPQDVLLIVQPFYFGALYIYIETEKARHHQEILNALDSTTKRRILAFKLPPAVERLIWDAFEKAVNQVEHIDVFHGDTNIYVKLCDLARGLKKGDRLSAVCFYKNWDSRPLIRYFKENVDAVLRRGVDIIRVFADGQEESIKEFQRQMAAGIRCRVISAELLERHTAQLGLPKEMGFVVTASWVFLHIGKGPTAQGFFIPSEVVASQVQAVFNGIEAESQDSPDLPQAS